MFPFILPCYNIVVSYYTCFRFNLYSCIFFSDKRDSEKENSNKTNEIKESDEYEDSICWADDEEAEIASFLKL